MNSSTTAPVGLAEEMVQLFSKHLTAYIADNPEANIGDVTT